MPRLADPDLPARRRSQILDAARACFHHRGFRQTTIEEICADARISPGLLYRYFESKADIVAAVALESRAEAETMLERLSDADGLIQGMAELARSIFQHGDAALMADIWAEALRDPVLAKALTDRARLAKDLMAASIARGQASGALYPALAPEDAAEVLMAALEGMALRRALAGGDAEATLRFRALALHLLKPKR